MRTIFLILIFAVAGSSQAPGSVTVASTITALAGTITCSFNLAAQTDVTLVCKQTATGGVELINTPVHLPLATSAFTWQSNQGSDAITGTFTRGAAQVNWTVAANGNSKSGAF